MRIHLNQDEGVRWWAEDDLGFTGGSDDLEELLGMIAEWAECEGVLADLSVSFTHDALMATLPQPTEAIGVPERL
ncbi:MAG: hypothetical protein OXI18_03835 [bacterium]|nr:hypothetical protein [bacterium]